MLAFISSLSSYKNYLVKAEVNQDGGLQLPTFCFLTPTFELFPSIVHCTHPNDCKFEAEDVLGWTWLYFSQCSPSFQHHPEAQTQAEFCGSAAKWYKPQGVRNTNFPQPELPTHLLKLRFEDVDFTL